MSSASSSGYLKQLQLLFFALLMGQIMLALVMYFIQEGELFFDLYTGGIYVWTSIFVFTTCIVGGFIFYSSNMRKIQKLSDIEIRMSEYRKISIVRFGLIEAASITCILLFFTSGNLLLLGLSVISILTFLFLRPSKAMILSDLGKDDLVKSYLEE